LSACYFYGVGFNLIFLLPAVLVPLLLIGSCSAGRLLALTQTNRMLICLCVVFLVLLTVHHLFVSISPDSSFAATLILAALPLWTLVAVLCERRELLLSAVFVVVLAFAAVSAGQYLFSGQRAHAPLWDPNTYVSLLYLAWIPWVFGRLSDAPTAAGKRTLSLIWTFAGSFIFALALLAAHSRVAMLVVAGVSLGSLLCCIWFRLHWPQAAAVAAAAVLAAGLYLGVDQNGLTAAVAQEQSAQDGGGVRWLMLEAALRAVWDRGGVSGTGLGTFTLLYPLYRSLDEQSTVGAYVHNDYVQLLLEGGVWLLLPLAVLCICLLLSGLRTALSRTWHTHVGLLLALGCVLAHAAVNYVVYVLPLTIVMGVYIGALFVRDTPPEDRVPSATPGRSWLRVTKWAGLAVLLLNCFYLTLDALTLGVFSNQLHMPGAAYIKDDPDRMLRYARTAQRLNGRRGVPVLGEALLLDNALSRNPSQALLVRTELAYQRAIETDPWNPQGHVSYAKFLLRQSDALGTQSRTRAKQQLQAALALNPTDVNAGAELFSLYRRDGDLGPALALASQVLGWCEIIIRRGAPQTHPVFREIEALTRVDQGALLSSALDGCRQRSHPASGSGREPTWMMRWLRSFSHADS